MARFIPCAGPSACTEGGAHCRGCGRSHGEIERTRQAVDALVEVALQYGYENPEDFAAYVARRIAKKTEHQRVGGGTTLPIVTLGGTGSGAGG